MSLSSRSRSTISSSTSTLVPTPTRLPKQQQQQQQQQQLQTTSHLAVKLRSLTSKYADKHQFGSAVFWAGQLTALTKSDDDFVLQAEVLLRSGQFRRSAEKIMSRKIHSRKLKGAFLAAQALFMAQEYEDAISVLEGLQSDEDEDNVNALEDDEDKELTSSVLVLKGKIYECLDNRSMAAESFREALKADAFCAEALDLLVQHQALSAEEELRILDQDLRLEDAEELRLVKSLYEIKLKKYAKPDDVKITCELMNDSNLDVKVQLAERHFYNLDYELALSITEEVIDDDPFHPECLPLHVSCLVEMDKSNRLFLLGHRLVEQFPEWSVAWYAVGSYYFLTGRQDSARRYLAKATQLDRLFAPAWLAYGHSFARDNEHDQAMAAYFKACQLMRGSHLPLLYIGVEYGLTNNSKMAERFFKQAKEIAPEDPFVLHELGVVAYQNQRFEEAETHFAKAVAGIRNVRARWEPLISNMGHVMRKLGRLDESLYFHREALALKPMNASTYAAIGHVLALKGDTLEAAEAFHSALGIRRDDTFATTMLNSVVEQMSSVLDGTLPFTTGSSGEPPSFESMPARGQAFLDALENSHQKSLTVLKEEEDEEEEEEDAADTTGDVDMDMSTT